MEGYNLLFNAEPCYKRRKGQWKPEDINCTEAFKNIAKADWHNGAVILTCTSLARDNTLKSYLPVNLLKTNVSA